MSGNRTPSNHDDNGNNEDNYQTGESSKHEVSKDTKYKENNQTHTVKVDSAGSKAGNYVIPLPSHAIKHFTTKSTISGKTINQPVSGINSSSRSGGGDVTRKSVTSKILNAAMVAHLHQLEVRNQKLEKEKTSLENQLAHILKRLRTDETNGAGKSTSKDQYPVIGTDSENRLQTLLLKKKSDEEKKIDQVDDKLTSKYAPLACYDCMNDRQSLLESNSSFSLGEYSSLSDAYEEICLNKNPVDDINGSDLSEMFAEHNKTLIQDTEVLTNNLISKQSVYIDDSMNQPQNSNQRQPQPSQPEKSTLLPEVVNKSDRRLESDKDLLFKPDDLLIYRPDEDDEDNSSESQYNNSSITSSSDLDIPTHRTVTSRKHQFISSRDEKLSSSLSIVSYNSSTDSMILKGHHFEDSLPRYNIKSNKPYSTSLPVSPVILPARWLSKGNFIKPADNYAKMYKLERSYNPSIATQSSANPDRITTQSQSHANKQRINRANSFNLSVSDNSDVYSLTIGSNTPQSQRRLVRNFNKVPPKVHISRKHLYRPIDNQQFSDTSSSINQIDRNEDVSIKYFPSHRNLQPIYLNTNRSNQSVTPQAESVEQVNQSKIYFPSPPPPPSSSSSLPPPGTSVMNQPPYSVPVNNLGRKQLASTLQQERLPSTQLKMGSINDFLNNNLQPSFHTNLKYFLVNDKDLLTLKYLLNFIKFFEVFTCVSGFAYLLQSIKLNITNLMPILQTYENTTSREQLSSTNSESSLNRAINISKLLINSNKAIDQPSVSNLIPLKPLSNELYNSEENTPEVYRVTTSEEPYTLSNIPDESKLIISENHAGVLLKLNNHLKIWHYYWCILTLKGLFLHQYQQTGFSQLSSLNQPKKVILFSDIHYLRRSTNMSTSINQLGCSNLIKIDSSMSLSSSTTVTTKGAVNQRPNVSAPVSRKFMHTDSFPKYRVEKYFELVLHNKKVYRLRGIDSQQTAKWINLIKDIQRINEADRILNENRSQITKEGWLKRIKRGHVSWFWCKLAGVYLIYSLSPKSTIPVGCKTLKDAYVQITGNRSTISAESNVAKKSDGLLKLSTDQYDPGQLLTSSSDSDSLLLSLTYSKANQDEQQTIKIWTPDHEPVYLICPTLQECEQWRDSLLRASILHSNPTAFINSTQKSSAANLLENIQKIWKHLVNPIHLNSLYHSNVSIKQPISKTTPSDHQSIISLRLFDHLLFLCHPQVNLIDNSNSQSTEIPISSLISCSQWLTLKHLIMKQIINFCFKYPLLKDELYLQLIKQAIFAGINTKQISKDAYQLLLKSKTTLKHSLTSLLLCTKQQNFSDTSYSINTTTTTANNQQIKFYENLKQNNQDSYFQIGDQYRQSLSEVSSLLSSPSSTAKLIISQTNLNSNTSNKRPECWWPAIAIWECLCLFLTFILPSEPVIKCLEGLFNLHLNSVHIDSTGSADKIDIPDRMKSENIQLKMKFFTEISGYAAFCQDTLNRTKRYGGREYYPSALEVFTLSIRNPYTHVYPFSLPVYLPFGSNYEVVNFHGGSSIHDLQVQIIEKLQLNEFVFKNIVLFAIYLCLGQSVADSKQVYLNPSWKICDIISVYEQSTLQNLQSQQNNESNLIRLDQISVKLLFKIQTFSWKCMRNLEYKISNIFLLNFIVHQLHASIISSFYQIPMRGIDFIDLIAYLCRADYYDYTELQKRHEQITFSQLLENYLPFEWLPKNLTDSRLFIQIKLIVLERWTQISKYSQPPKEHGTLNLNDKINNKDNFKSDHENQMNMATFYACLGYLKHLKSLFPYRFNCSAYLARVDNLPLVEENQLIWIVPQDDRINILTGGNLLKLSNSQLPQRVILSESKKIICLKSIAYRNVVAYGGQQNGVFFLVYSDFTLGKTQCPSTSRDFPDPDLISSQRRSNSFKGHNYYPSSSASSTSLSFCKGYGNYSQRIPPSRSKESRLLNKHQCMSLKKLKFFLTDIHSIIDLTSVLTFLINAKCKSSTT